MVIEPSARGCDATPVEGFFADPKYGGNNNKGGWKMIGLPGAYADYYDLIQKRGVPSRGAIGSPCHLKHRLGKRLDVRGREGTLATSSLMETVGAIAIVTFSAGISTFLQLLQAFLSQV